MRSRTGNLAAELARELPNGHILCGASVRAVAVRVDCDEVLFEVERPEAPRAVVHLTWQKETDPKWPGTQLFSTWEEWAHQDMLPAHRDYTV